MQPAFPQIKVKQKEVDIRKVRKLKHDLRKLRGHILLYSPSDYNPAKLNRLRIRIFKFSKQEGCNEFFTIVGNKKYVCLNTKLLHKRYYAALLYVLHGIAHSFCHLRDEVAEEAFCEHVCYSIMASFTGPMGKKFSKRIIRGITINSPRIYNNFYKAAKKLEEKKCETMIKLNMKAKNRSISKKKEKKIFYRLTKLKRYENEELIVPELEKGFRKV